MLNVLRPAMTRLFTPVGKVLARTPITPNAITVIGTVGVAGGALGLFPIGELFPGAFTCTIFVFLDMLDGVLARMKGTTGTWGAFLDSTMDRIADAGIFSGLVIWFMLGGRNPLLAGVSLFCLVAGNLVSYVKARAEGLGLRCDVGLIERPERMVISLVAVGVSGLGVPYILNVGLWALAVGSAFTFWQRVHAVYKAAKAPGDQGGSPSVGWRGSGWLRKVSGGRTESSAERAADGGRVPAGLEGDLPPSAVVGALGLHRGGRHRVAPAGAEGPGARGQPAPRAELEIRHGRGGRQGTAHLVPGRAAVLRQVLARGVPAAGDPHRTAGDRDALPGHQARRRCSPA